MAVTSISFGSRPTSSQWRRSTSSLWATSSGPPKMLHASAYCATSRSVFRSPLPPIMIRGRGELTGMRAAQRLGELVVPAVGTGRCRRSTSAGRSGSPPRAARSAPRSAGTARRGRGARVRTRPRRCRARPGRPTRRRACVTVLASRPGWRYVTPVTSSRNRERRCGRRRNRARCSPRASGPRPAPSSPSGRSDP